ncbi:hypothetical protein BTM450_11900 [Helicobacter pylori]
MLISKNIRSEVKKLENQMIEATTRLLTSYQIFLNNAKEGANHQITENKTQAITNINEAKESANHQITENKTQSLEAINNAKESTTTQINTDKTASLEAIKEAKEQAKNEISGAKKTDHYQNIDFFEIE